MPTAIKGCYSCDIRVTEACEAAYHEQCPPCAKLAVENGNSLQQLKAEIADKKVESNQVCDYCVRRVGAKVACSFSVQDFSCFRGRQLSAI